MKILQGSKCAWEGSVCIATVKLSCCECGANCLKMISSSGGAIDIWLECTARSIPHVFALRDGLNSIEDFSLDSGSIVPQG